MHLSDAVLSGLVGKQLLTTTKTFTWDTDTKVFRLTSVTFHLSEGQNVVIELNEENLRPSLSMELHNG